MVFRFIVANLLELMRNLSYIYERSRATYYNELKTPVKGKGYLLYALTTQIPTLNLYSGKFREFKTLKPSVENWIKIFNENYGEIETEGKPLDLTSEDSKKLMDDSNNWIDLFISYYSTESTELIKQQEISNIFPKKKYKKLDKNTRYDLTFLSSIIYR